MDKQEMNVMRSNFKLHQATDEAIWKVNIDDGQ
jgi:hypothetical protein